MKPLTVQPDEHRGQLDLSAATRAARQRIDRARVRRELVPIRPTWWGRLRRWLARMWAAITGR